MSGLVLKLAPGERVLINGAVIENGARRSSISIQTPNANILRLRDAIHPDHAKTPVAGVCYVAQLILSGDIPAEEGRARMIRGLEHLSQVFDDRDSRIILDQVTNATLDGQTYQALRQLRQLLAREARLLAMVRQ